MKVALVRIAMAAACLACSSAASGATQLPAPTNLSAAAASASEIDLRWTDNASRETGYSVERSPGTTSSFVAIATLPINATTYADVALPSGTTYSYRVRALGRRASAYSNVATATTAGTADVTPPSVAITSPGSGATYSTSQTVQVVAGATDVVGVARVELYLDGALRATASGASAAYAWSIGSSDDGTHTWAAKAYDAAGNVGVSANVTVSVNIPASSPPANANVVVDTTAPLRTLSPTFHGVNYVGFWDSLQGSSGSAAAFAHAGVGLVRFPGGVPGDWYDWRCPYYTGATDSTRCPSTPNSSSWSSTSPLDLWHFASSFGAAALYQTNYAGNVPPPPGISYAANTAQAVADWATYNKQQGISAVFEVGNEEDINMQSVHDANFQPYVDAFQAQAQAIHSADPAAKVFGPVGTNEWFWWALDSLGMFLQQAGNAHGTGRADGVSLHFYRGSGWSDSLSTAQYWEQSGGPWQFIRSTIAANDTRALPVFISEWHVGASSASYNASVANALTVADLIGAFAHSGVAGHQYFAQHGAGLSSNAYGVLYGAGDTRPADTAAPAYYALALWKQMGATVLPRTQSFDASAAVSTWAARAADGSIQLMAINKTSAAQALSIGFNGYDPTGKAVSIYTLRPSVDLNSVDAIYDGATNPPPSQALPGPASSTAAGSVFGYSLPAYSIAVLSFAAN